ncbi:hypothetical protein AVEN_225691-1 [Araneus ventricosus]|uniref:Uncharacterized protein n=1 Tax=Araneus ventricosus TaxID=182803 RepID=A0A4Y2FTW3_ARAVE|nr:hypothetical protein AVEN_225691-1 [Araneus ventricosus]
MGHRTEQVPQREVLVKTPTKGVGADCFLVDVMKRVNYLRPEKPLATKRQAQEKEEDEGVKRKCEGRERGDFWKRSSEEDRDEQGLDFLGGNKIDLGR